MGISTSRKAFTLVEVLVASFVLMAVVLIVYRLLFAAQKSTDLTTLRADLKTRARAVVDGVLRELTEAKIVSISSSNDAIEFQVPVDADGSNGMLDASGEVEYGFRDPRDGSQEAGWKAVYRVVAEQTLSESALKVDINKDGDQADGFALCRLQREVKDGAGKTVDTVALAHEIFLNSSPADGDVNGDGQPDPFFQMLDAVGQEVLTGGEVFVLNVWVGRKYDIQDYVLHNSRVTVMLRNDQ